MQTETYIILKHTPLEKALLAFPKIMPGPILHGALVFLLLTLLALAYFFSSRSRGEGGVLPSEKPFSLGNLMELAVSGLLAFLKTILGEHARTFLPLIGGAAFFILFSNLLGSIPGFEPPTSNLNTTLACAAVIIVATHVVGFRAHGPGYIKQFLGPILALSWLMFPIELISHAARLLSLSIRLFGNMFGDHKVLAIFVGLVPLGVPVVFMGMGIFVSLVQTFVFTLLSAIYINLALEEAH